MNDLFGGTLPEMRKPKPAVRPGMWFASEAVREFVDDALQWMTGYHVCEYPLTEAQATILLRLRNNPEVKQLDLKEWGDDFEQLVRLGCVRFADRASPLIVQFADGFVDVWQETERRIRNWIG